MITILRNLARACYDKSFYQETERDSFGRRYVHIYVLFVIIVGIFMVQMIGVYIANRAKVESLPNTINTFLDVAYPDDLALRFENNKLSINQSEPYVIGNDVFDVFGSDTPDETMTTTAEQDVSTATAFLTIDTNASIDDFDTYDTLILAMEHGVAMKQSERGEVRYYPYADMLQEVPQPITFDSVSYGQIVNTLRPYINQIPIILLYAVTVGAFLIASLGPLFLASGVSFNILFLALLGYVVARIIGRPHSYTYLYKLGMYAAIPIIILQQLTALVAFEGLSGAWWLIALLVLVIFIPRTGGALAKQSDSPPQPTDPPKIA